MTEIAKISAIDIKPGYVILFEYDVWYVALYTLNGFGEIILHVTKDLGTTFDDLRLNTNQEVTAFRPSTKNIH